MLHKLQSISLIALFACMHAAAQYIPSYMITFSMVPSSDSIIYYIDGNPLSGTQIFDWEEGSQHTVSIAAEHFDSQYGYKFTFLKWSTDSAQNFTYTVGSTNQTFVAEMHREFHVTVESNADFAGTVSISPDKEWFNINESFTITATPNTGFEFINWDAGSFVTSKNPFDTIVEKSYHIYGNFNYTEQTVKFATNHLQSPQAVYRIDGTAYWGDTSFVWMPGDSHTVSADTIIDMVGNRFRFNKWSNGQPATYTHHVQAHPDSVTLFYDLQHKWIMTVNPSGSGTISTNPASDGFWFTHGQAVTLKALPGQNFIFDKWQCSGGKTSNVDSISLTVTGEGNCIAYFEEAITAAYRPIDIADKLFLNVLPGYVVFGLPNDEFVRIEIINLRGTVIAVAADNFCQSGIHQLSVLKSTPLAAGHYVCRFIAGKDRILRRFVVH